MKKYVLSFFCLLIMAYSNAQNVSPFKFDDLSTPSDFNSGATFNTINSFLDYADINKIKSVNIKRKHRENKYSYEETFENGFLIKHKMDPYDTNDTYTYDEKGNLITVGTKISYKYLSYECRELYNGNYGLQYREFVFFAKDYVNIILEKVKPNTDNKMQLYKDTKYFYKDNKIQKVTSDFYMLNELSSTCTYDFSYENGLLTKLVIGYGPDDIRDIYTAKYNDKKQIIEVEDNRVSQPECSSITYYSNYDSHGNWLFSKRYNGKNLIETVVRKFEYTD